MLCWHIIRDATGTESRNGIRHGTRRIREVSRESELGSDGIGLLEAMSSRLCLFVRSVLAQCSNRVASSSRVRWGGFVVGPAAKSIMLSWGTCPHVSNTSTRGESVWCSALGCARGARIGPWWAMVCEDGVVGTTGNGTFASIGWTVCTSDGGRVPAPRPRGICRKLRYSILPIDAHDIRSVVLYSVSWASAGFLLGLSGADALCKEGAIDSP